MSAAVCGQTGSVLTGITDTQPGNQPRSSSSYSLVDFGALSGFALPPSLPGMLLLASGSTAQQGSWMHVPYVCKDCYTCSNLNSTLACVLAPLWLRMPYRTCTGMGCAPCRVCPSPSYQFLPANCTCLPCTDGSSTRLCGDSA